MTFATQTQELLETTFSESLQVDEEAGVIRNVKILGRQSRNRREYSVRAMESAARLYEGMGVKLNHPPRDNPGKERLFEEGFGELRNTRFDNSRGGCFGDLHYLKHHPLAGAVVEAAQRFPKQLGMSHNARGEVSRRGDRFIVEDVEEVLSVDLVSRPATNEGLFESEETNPMSKKTVRQVIEAAREGSLGRKWLERLVEMEMVSPEMAVEAPSSADMSPEGAVTAAFRNKVMAVFDDESLDAKATIKAISDLVKQHEKVLQSLTDKKPAGEGEEEAAAAGDGGGMSESAQVKQLNDKLTSLTEQLDTLTKREQIRGVLSRHGLAESDLESERLKLLEQQADADAMEAIVESWPPYMKASRRGGPRSAPLTESSGGLDKFPEDAKEFAKAAR